MDIVQIGRLGRVFAADSDTTYANPPTLAATDAFRHIDIELSHDWKRRDSLEKRGTPGLRDRFPSHVEAGYNLKKAYWSPSGTIQTPPEARVFLRNGFGVERVGALSTTIASGAGVGGATLASGTGLAVGDGILIRSTGTPAGDYPRILTSVSGAAVTWAPDLPASPNTSDVVKNGVTYRLANELPKDFDLAWYLPNLSFELKGAVADKLQFDFDSNSEAMISSSGPGQFRVRPAQSQPGAFTTVGSPVTGIVGSFLFNGASYCITKMTVAIDNMEKLENWCFGTDRAEGFYRDGRRSVTLTISAYMTDNVSLLAAGETYSDNSLLVYAGNAQGRIVGLFMPRIELDSPLVTDADGAIQWAFKGVAKETVAGLGGTATAGNDEVIAFCV